MFVAEILIKRGKQLIAARGLFCKRGGVREDALLLEVAPEIILHHTHRGWIGPEHLLRLFDLLAIQRGDILEILCEVWVRHCGP